MTTDAMGGIWTYGLDLGRGLAARGCRVTLAVLGPGLDQARRIEAEGAGLDVVETGCQPEWLARDAADVSWTAVRIGAVARQIGADVVHLNHPALAGCAPRPCPVVGVAHSCLATWWDAVRDTPLPGDFTWRTALVGHGYAAVDALIAPSRAFADATRRLYGETVAPMVVHNGRAMRGDIGAPQEPEPVVFTAGRLWDEGKNVAALDRAAGLLAARDATCRVQVAGPLRGPNGASVAFDHVEALGLLDAAAMAARLAARPIYAAPALYEPFGLAVVEAAQAGCALVLSDRPTFRELWDGAALFVPPHDADTLADALHGLLGDPSRRGDLGREAAARAGRYTVDAMVDRTVAIHSAVLGRTRAARSRTAVR